MPPFEIGMRLTFEGNDRWRVGFGDEAVARYHWDDIRFSVSWKAYCYADEAERRLVEEHGDDLTRERIMTDLLADLRRRGRLGDAAPQRHRSGSPDDRRVHPLPRAGSDRSVNCLLR